MHHNFFALKTVFIFCLNEKELIKFKRKLIETESLYDHGVFIIH